MIIKPGDLLKERYRIQSMLGEGGMGAVYLANDLSLKIQVAVKFNRTLTEENKEQFLREARLLARLHHPNLPRVIDYFIIEDFQFLVMDYIPGTNLGFLYENKGAQSLEDILGWTEQIVNALNYLHQQDPPVIHRDIKPANIKLTPNGNVILVDFGIAKASDASQVTALGASGYTPGFAPPEQYGSARTGTYSDQFSLAATIYTLLSGQQPEDSVKRALNKAVLTPIELLVPDLPLNIKFALEKAMTLKASDRFQSINDFYNVLTDPDYLNSSQTVPIKEKTVNNEKKSIGKFALLAAGILTLGILVTAIFFLLIAILDPDRSLFSKAPTISISATQTAVFDSTNLTATPLTQPSETMTLPAPVIEITATSVDSPTPQPRQIGGRIAFVSDRGDGKTAQIWTMKVALDNLGELITYDLEQITDTAGNKSQPAWSHNGNQLVYVSEQIQEGNIHSTGKDLWIIDINDPESVPVNLTKLPGDDYDPEWSPDDSMIVFTNLGRYNDIRQLYTINADGTDLSRLSLDFEEYSATWSPDMEWLLFVINARDHKYLNRRYMKNITVLEPVPTPERYDVSSVFGRLGDVEDPAWSPDGNFIAYTRLEGNTKRIYSVEYKSRGNDINLLAGDTFKDKEPAWSPDTQWIVFTSERDGNSEIYLMKSTGAWQTNLTNFEGIDMQPAWQKVQ